MYKLFTDGGSRGNPGSAAAAFFLFNDEELVTFGGEYLNTNTNNHAEYKGLLIGLKEALKHDIQEISVFMDSELIVKQIKGEYKISSEELKPLFVKVKELMAMFTLISFNHVPRADNKFADRLVNIILDEHAN